MNAGPSASSPHAGDTSNDVQFLKQACGAGFLSHDQASALRSLQAELRVQGEVTSVARLALRERMLTPEMTATVLLVLESSMHRDQKPDGLFSRLRRLFGLDARRKKKLEVAASQPAEPVALYKLMEEQSRVAKDVRELRVAVDALRRATAEIEQRLPLELSGAAQKTKSLKTPLCQ